MKASVLLIEANPDRVLLFKQFLPNCAVFVTDRPTAAVAMIRSRPFNVIFLDYTLGNEVISAEVLRSVKKCNSCRPPAYLTTPFWVVHSTDEEGAQRLVSTLAWGKAKVARLARAWEFPDLEAQLRSLGAKVS